MSKWYPLYIGSLEHLDAKLILPDYQALFTAAWFR